MQLPAWLKEECVRHAYYILLFRIIRRTSKCTLKKTTIRWLFILYWYEASSHKEERSICNARSLVTKYVVGGGGNNILTYWIYLIRDDYRYKYGACVVSSVPVIQSAERWMAKGIIIIILCSEEMKSYGTYQPTTVTVTVTVTVTPMTRQDKTGQDRTGQDRERSTHRAQRNSKCCK